MADDNRPIKYVRYAFGEIVLVVIGILIALQVNEWNEERKMKSEERNSLTRLHIESELIVAYINNRIKNGKFLINAMELTAKALDRKTLDTLDVNDFARGIFVSGFYEGISPPRSTFDELNSTGKMQLIRSNQVQKAISDYYVELDFIGIQLVYFRNQFTDPVSAAPEDFYYTYNPDFEWKIMWNVNFDNLANNRVFVSKYIKALRDQIVFHGYYKDQLLVTAQQMCRELGRELNVSCTSEMNNQ